MGVNGAKNGAEKRSKTCAASAGIGGRALNNDDSVHDTAIDDSEASENDEMVDCADASSSSVTFGNSVLV